MSRENVEIVRSIYRRGDPSRFFDLLDEKVEQDATALPHMPENSGLLRGKDELVREWRRYWGTWENYTMEPIEFIDAARTVSSSSRRSAGAGREAACPLSSGRSSSSPFGRARS
jgi:ketosteroid isomerase-like protein